MLLQIIVAYDPTFKSWGATIWTNGFEEQTFYAHTKKEAIAIAESWEPDTIYIYNKEHTKYIAK